MTARENICRALRKVGLARQVTITEERVDRIIVQPAPGLASILIARGWSRDVVIASSHAGAVASYREPGAVMPALQIVFLADGRAEIDLDLASPSGGDIASAVVHAFEVGLHWITGRKSNQERIARALDRRFGNAETAGD